MPYNITFKGASHNIPDGASQQITSDFRFIGQNTPEYGTQLNQNFASLLENFASATAPTTPTNGQLWYDTGNKLLKVNEGSTWKSFTTVFTGNQPFDVESSIGNLWINNENKLFYFDGTEWLEVLGNNPSNSRIVGVVRIDSNGITRNTLEVIVDNITVLIFNNDRVDNAGGDITADTSDEGWIPAGEETLVQGNASATLISKFPRIFGGMNINNDYILNFNIKPTLAEFIFGTDNNIVPYLDDTGLIPTKFIPFTCDAGDLDIETIVQQVIDDNSSFACDGENTEGKIPKLLTAQAATAAVTRLNALGNNYSVEDLVGKLCPDIIPLPILTGLLDIYFITSSNITDYVLPPMASESRKFIGILIGAGSSSRNGGLTIFHYTKPENENTFNIKIGTAESPESIFERVDSTTRSRVFTVATAKGGDNSLSNTADITQSPPRSHSENEVSQEIVMPASIEGRQDIGFFGYGNPGRGGALFFVALK